MNILETNRLIIRTFVETDWQDLHNYMTLPEVVMFEPYEVFTEQDCVKECYKRSQDKTHSFWAVCLKNSNTMIGHLYFSLAEPAELNTYSIGYVFNPQYYGKGYATEACKEMLDYGFKVKNAHRIIAQVDVKNRASWRLLERLKMRKEAHQLKNIYFKLDKNGYPIWKDSYQYALLNSEYNH
ncbi:GNAT family N-acetyltransferase [Clostridium sp. 'deep sea']|uniref:GNAT family N-acetyltransferase n=1 Tax=Clostridium sp. 'deep sea' TaxID=2779445 RepID=UPI0018966AB6|nr:GNAT family N-acetyltransferase [Clostridium sp. 'deep sea']QOR35150.1 GNAT family N-acetyltransferase [Clostridium sp. 'deep sea']